MIGGQVAAVDLEDHQVRRRQREEEGLEYPAHGCACSVLPVRGGDEKKF